MDYYQHQNYRMHILRLLTSLKSILGVVSTQCGGTDRQTSGGHISCFYTRIKLLPYIIFYACSSSYMSRSPKGFNSFHLLTVTLTQGKERDKDSQLSLNSMPAGRVNSALSAEMSWDLIKQNNTMRRENSSKIQDKTEKKIKMEDVEEKRVGVWPAVLLLSSDHGFDHASLHLQLSRALYRQHPQFQQASTKFNFTEIQSSKHYPALNKVTRLSIHIQSWLLHKTMLIKY